MSEYVKNGKTYDISKLNNKQASFLYEALKQCLEKINSHKKEIFLLTAAQETLQSQLESFLDDTVEVENKDSSA